MDDRQSTCGYSFFLGSITFSWWSWKQQCVVLLLIEVEYMGLVKTSKEALWLRYIIHHLHLDMCTIPIHCDNQSTIQLFKNPKFHRSTKHVDIYFHKVRKCIEDKESFLKSSDVFLDRPKRKRGPNFFWKKSALCHLLWHNKGRKRALALK